MEDVEVEPAHVPFETLLERARALVPVLRERGRDTNRLRRLPDETVKDFWEAGLWGALRPRLFGGSEIRYDQFLAIARELGRGDGSAAWVYAVVGVHDLMVSYFPKSAQAKVWSNPRALIASSFMPTGTPTPVKGGYLLSGRWSFCSGVDHSEWALLSAMFETADNPPRPAPRFMLTPLSQCEIVDDWYVMGLAGTGSKTVVAKDVFVADDQVVSFADMVAGVTPGGGVHAGHIYRAPLWLVFPFCVSAPAPGIARGALEQFCERIKDRRSKAGQAPMAEMRHIDMRVAEAGALIDAAELLYVRAARETMDAIEAGETPSREHRLRSRRDQAYSILMATRAADLLLKSTGGHGVYDADPVQRACRDLHALGAHRGSNWDLPSANYGAVALGGEPYDAMF